MSRFLIIELPQSFPEPAHDPEAFQSAAEGVLRVVGWASDLAGAGELRLTYRATPDDLAEELVRDFTRPAVIA